MMPPKRSVPVCNVTSCKHFRSIDDNAGVLTLL